MPTPLLKRVRVMAAKVEGTVGTAETLTAAEGAFNVYDLVMQASIDVEDREAQGAFNRLHGVPGARSGTATFKTDIGWDGTTTMPSWASVLLPGCGWVESSQVYTPRSEALGANVKSLTIGCFIDGMFKSLAGAVGTFKLVCPSGRMAYIEWEFQGVWQAPTDTAIIAPTYPTASPIRFANATITYDAVAMGVEQVTLDAASEIVMREDPTTAAGYISGLVTDRKPIITANPETVLVADQDRFGKWLDYSEASLSIVLDGPTDSTITVTAPKAQIVNNQESDRGKMVVDDIEFWCNKNATTNDQEVSITFAEATP